jgi:hypothetical protein
VTGCGPVALGLAMLVGALIGIPRASYLTALHNLVTGKSSTATQVIAVAVFVLIGIKMPAAARIPSAWITGARPISAARG